MSREKTTGGKRTVEDDIDASYSPSRNKTKRTRTATVPANAGYTPGQGRGHRRGSLGVSGVIPSTTSTGQDNAANAAPAMTRPRDLHDCQQFFEENYFPNRAIWKPGDPLGDKDASSNVKPNKNRKFVPYESWSLAKAPLTIMASPYNLPPSNVSLEDVWVYYALLLTDPLTRGKTWPNDFDGRGRVRRERVPCGPPVLYQMLGTEGFFIAEFNGYVLGGDCVAATKRWLITGAGDESNLTNLRTVTFGNVKWNPAWPMGAGAVVRQMSVTNDGQTNSARKEIWEVNVGPADRKGHERYVRDTEFEIVDYGSLGLGGVVSYKIPNLRAVGTAPPFTAETEHPTTDSDSDSDIQESGSEQQGQGTAQEEDNDQDNEGERHNYSDKDCCSEGSVSGEQREESEDSEDSEESEEIEESEVQRQYLLCSYPMA